jgi:glyoxylase-like metal-dependent hydrolase (beta-lactamase superfamily II)
MENTNQKLSSRITLIDVNPPIPGFDRFIASYLLHGEKTALVDVGPTCGVPGLLSTLREMSIQTDDIAWVILSHIHLDHAGGIGTAMKAFPNAKLIVHPRGRAHLIDPSRLWQGSLETLGELALQYGSLEPVPAERIIAAEEGMIVDLGSENKWEILLTPGHASHHLSLFNRQEKLLIAGEAGGICADGIFRITTPPPFKLDETLSSIDKLIALSPEKICYAHFGCYDGASEKLQRIRDKTLEWYRIISMAADEGKSDEEILEIMKQKDDDLVYLKMLGDAYRKR